MTGKTSHGDDLGYIFDPNNIDGQPLDKGSNFSEEDKQVRDVFTDLVANFARNGNVSVKTKSNNGDILPLSLPSFSGNNDDDSYLSITSKPKISNKFM